MRMSCAVPSTSYTVTVEASAVALSRTIISELIVAAVVVPLAAIQTPLVPLFAWATEWSLRLCGWVVDAADRLRGGHIYVGDVPGWWLAVFYAGLLSALAKEERHRR